MKQMPQKFPCPFCEEGIMKIKGVVKSENKYMTGAIYECKDCERRITTKKIRKRSREYWRAKRYHFIIKYEEEFHRIYELYNIDKEAKRFKDKRVLKLIQLARKEIGYAESTLRIDILGRLQDDYRKIYNKEQK